MKIKTQERTLHSNNSGPCVDLGGKHIFQDQVKNASNKSPISIQSNENKIIFNKSPISIQSNENKIIFNRQTRDF